SIYRKGAFSRAELPSLGFERVLRKCFYLENANNSLLLKGHILHNERKLEPVQHQTATMLGGVLGVAPLQGHGLQFCDDRLYASMTCRPMPSSLARVTNLRISTVSRPSGPRCICRARRKMQPSIISQL